MPQLTALVHVADLMSYQLDLGAPGAWPPKECDADALKLLGLDMERTADFHDKIQEELEHAMEILKLLD